MDNDKTIHEIFENGSKTRGLEILGSGGREFRLYCHRNQDYGSELLEVSEDDVRALLDGKVWAFPVNDGEYHHFVVLKKGSR